MITQIDSSSYPVPLVPSEEKKSRATTTNPVDNDPSTAASSTNVSLGAASAQLNNMNNMGAGVANTTVSVSKVAEIKQAITEGRFQVNTSAVADSLIKSVTDLIASQQA
jgi:negative regulator of flagellin synthesis FlgM